MHQNWNIVIVLLIYITPNMSQRAINNGAKKIIRIKIQKINKTVIPVKWSWSLQRISPCRNGILHTRQVASTAS